MNDCEVKHVMSEVKNFSFHSKTLAYLKVIKGKIECFEIINPMKNTCSVLFPLHVIAIAFPISTFTESAHTQIQ